MCSVKCTFSRSTQRSSDMYALLSTDEVKGRATDFWTSARPSTAASQTTPNAARNSEIASASIKDACADWLRTTTCARWQCARSCLLFLQHSSLEALQSFPTSLSACEKRSQPHAYVRT